MPEQSYQEIQGTDLFADSPAKLNNTSRSIRQQNFGTSAPSLTAAWMTWYDTTANLWKVRNAANDAWITIGDLGVAGFGLLSKAGGTMTGAIAMGGFTITGLGLGTGTAAARQQEVDLKAPLASPAFTTDATLNVDPPTANSLTRKSWTQSQFLALAGGTMTGNLTLVGNASSNLHAVPRQQLADFVSFNTSAGHRHTGSDSRKVQGQDLDSTGHAVGSLLRANGSTYNHEAPILTQVVFRDTPDLVVDITTSPGTYQDVDVSAHTPAGAYVIILRVNLASAGASLRFRPDGSANDNANMNRTFAAGIDSEIWVPLNQSNRIFEWRFSNGSSSATKFHLVGYKRALL